MRTLLWMLVLSGAVGCNRGPRKPKFAETVAAGCDSVESCEALVDRARANWEKCKPTWGAKFCEKDHALLEQAQRKQRAFQQRENERSNERKRQAQIDERQRREAKREEEEAAEKTGLAAAEAESIVAWSEIKSDDCALRADDAACLAVNKFLANYPASSKAAEARVVIATSRTAKQRAEQQARDEQDKRDQQAAARAAAERAKNPPPPPPKPRVAKCCDGSIDSSCGCNGGAGCCFRRGGVCGCE